VIRSRPRSVDRHPERRSEVPGVSLIAGPDLLSPLALKGDTANSTLRPIDQGTMSDGGISSQHSVVSVKKASG
jgi:hypothetical protein